jgi:2-iminobutanoate/2-iminopropanoate deaminase
MFADSNTVFRWLEEHGPGHGFEKGEMTMRKTVFNSVRIGMAVTVIIVLAISAIGYSQARRAISVGESKGLPFSDGMLVGNTLYIAGQEGTDANNKLVAGGIGPETQAALENIQKVVKAAGLDLKDVVAVTVYLADIHEFGDMNKVYRSVMPDPKPTRATVQVAALVNNARIEISAIAVKGK